MNLKKCGLNRDYTWTKCGLKMNKELTKAALNWSNSELEQKLVNKDKNRMINPGLNNP